MSGKMNIKALSDFRMLAGALAILSCTFAQAGSSTNAERVAFGPFATANWRSDDFAGTAYRKWDDKMRSFQFSWHTRVGDQIGSIGVDFGSPYLQTPDWQGLSIADIPSGSVMSTEAEWWPSTTGWFYWSIYGWTHRTYTYWGSTDAPNGYDHEFYIVFYTQTPRERMLKLPGCVDKGTLCIDDALYDCYMFKQSHFTQWFAVRQSREWIPNPSIDIKRVFEYWRSQGLDGSQYLMSLAWALEGFAGSAGTLQLRNIVLPTVHP